MTSKHQLDFEMLPSLTTGSVIRRIDPDLDEPLSRLPQTYARAVAAIRFSHLLDYAEHDLALREAYLRAALAEYVSMEDTLVRDLRALKIHRDPIRSCDSGNPLLHIIRELRNLEVHLRSSKMAASKTKALYKHHNDGEDYHEIELDVWWIEPIQPREFHELHNSKHYHAHDIAQMLDWFNNGQKIWGVDELVRLATNAYAREIVREFGLLLPVPEATNDATGV